MKKLWNDKVFKILIASIIFATMNYIFYLIVGFEISILIILGMIEANIIINSEK